jgi:hypothetical protein
MKPFFIAVVIFAFIILNPACKKYKPEISNFDAETHNAGNSCIECHNEVQICGTVYNKTKSITKSHVIVKLLTASNKTGIVKATIKVDKSGNFYSIDKTDFKALYPVVEYSDGTGTRYMQSSINSGDCNNCHQEGNRIWIAEINLTSSLVSDLIKQNL